MAMNKKGFFFTVIALLVGGLMVLYFVGLTESRFTSNLPIIERRVLAINAYMNDLEDAYFNRILFVSSHRAFYSLALYVNQEGFVTDAKTEFLHILVLGNSSDGRSIDTVLGKPYMENHTLAYRIEELENVTNKKLKINTEFILEGIQLFQDTKTGPWAVRVEAIFHYIVNSTVADWDRNHTVNLTIPIDNMLDPLYLRGTGGIYDNVIHKSIHDDNWDPVNTSSHLQQGTYSYDTHAPSFLDRFEGNLTPSDCCGIESLVNLHDMPGIDTKNASAVDYCFFGPDINIPEICIAGDYGFFIWKIDNITDDYDFFRLDSYHVEKYNVTVKAYNAGCYYNDTTKTWSGVGCV